MAVKGDYYQVLSVARNASAENIKRAFRRLALKYHPDRNHQAGAEEKFKEINEAYEVLSSPVRRAAYDRFVYGEGEGFHKRSFEGFPFRGFGDIFEAFFGGVTVAPHPAPQRSADLHQKITLTLKEAAFGTEREITVLRSEPCTLCGGSGCQPNGQLTQCPHCHGTGWLRQVRRNIFGRFTNLIVCPQCQGGGNIVSGTCLQCQGTGTEKCWRLISVKIPAGVRDGFQFCLNNEGDAGERGVSPGNLYLSLTIEQHDFFTREGDDILYELSINFTQAALGAEVEVPTLYGNVKLNLPAGCQTGTIFQLKNKGVPHLQGEGYGNQLVRVVVVTPPSLTERQRRLFEELGAVLGPANGE